MPDLPANTTTSAVVPIGGSYSDSLEVVGDRDWIRVTLTAGQTYKVSLDGTGFTPISDPYLYFYSSSGLLLREDDDGGTTGLNAAITYTVLTTGSYYIGATAFNDAELGGYTVSVTTAPPPVPLDALDSGEAVADSNVTVFFAPAGVGFDGITGEGFNAFEKARFQAAFDLIEALTDLTFTVQTTAVGADFRLVLDTNEMADDLAYFYYPTPGDPNAGVGVFGGDTWDRAAGGDLQDGGYSFVTIVHELLHGLGLGHPHDDGGVLNGVTEPFDDYGDFNLNQGIFTTMSYNTGYHTGPAGSAPDVNELFGHEFGPMALDIALLQQKYGANTSTNAGNTVYTLASVNTQGTYWQSIWDASGSADLIRHTGGGGARIDLRAATLAYAAGGGGYISAVNGIAGGFTIAHGVVIENATGSSGNDVLIGNHVANTLNGGAGADTLNGGAGNDLFYVNTAQDTIVESAGNGTADRVAASASFVLDAGDNIEQLQTISAAGTAAINLTGNALAQRIFGNAGANALNDGGGAADTLTGGAGNDTYIIHNSGAQITENVGQGSRDRVLTGVSFTLAAGDSIDVLSTIASAGTGALNLIGNALVQSITGNAGANRINGGAGSDTLTGGGGADRFVFTSPTGPSNIDRITDYSVAADTIDLQNAVFSGLTEGALAAAAFRINATGLAEDGSDRVVYNTSNGYLYFDSDGLGAAGRLRIAILNAGLAMTHADIFVV